MKKHNIRIKNTDESVLDDNSIRGDDKGIGTSYMNELLKTTSSTTIIKKDKEIVKEEIKKEEKKEEKKEVKEEQPKEEMPKEEIKEEVKEEPKEETPKEEVKEELSEVPKEEVFESRLTYDLIELNLLQLGRIQNNDRLCLNIDKCVINIDTRYFMSIRRFFSGNGREVELNFIKALINTAIKYCYKIVDAESRTIEDKRKLSTLLANLQCAKNGLCKLKTTYIDDNLFQSQIDSITAKIDNNSTDCSNYIY